MPPRALALLLPVLLLTGCLGGRPPEPKAPPPTSTTSPNGEPLPFRAGADDCRGALAAWFNRADRNADGVLDADEMQADAERWFAAADLDRDGQVTASELAALRASILPEPEPQPDQADRAAPGGRRPVLRSQARVDPVMQADANADFRVSALEFRAHTAARFAQMGESGAVGVARVLESCATVRP